MYATPTDAATVMLLRPNSNADMKEIEVLMVLRNRRSRFVPGYHVYPGGILDPEDYEPGIERFCKGIDRKQASEILPDMSRPEKALGAWVAGIRETFEEVGMLIAEERRLSRGNADGGGKKALLRLSQGAQQRPDEILPDAGKGGTRSAPRSSVLLFTLDHARTPAPSL